ncbi:MAG: inositol monophosphatase, partial [Pseudomonadota bacterium]|nr:inositol monophosphatase [Pseudomonadota bacterium]
MVIDPQRVTDIIRETAQLDVLPRFRKLADDDIMEKAPGDVVTVADYEAEVRLSKALGALAPAAEILAEEAASRDGLELDDH